MVVVCRVVKVSGRSAGSAVWSTKRYVALRCVALRCPGPVSVVVSVRTRDRGAVTDARTAPPNQRMQVPVPVPMPMPAEVGVAVPRKSQLWMSPSLRSLRIRRLLAYVGILLPDSDDHYLPPADQLFLCIWT